MGLPDVRQAVIAECIGDLNDARDLALADGVRDENLPAYWATNVLVVKLANERGESIKDTVEWLARD